MLTLRWFVLGCGLLMFNGCTEGEKPTAGDDPLDNTHNDPSHTNTPPDKGNGTGTNPTTTTNNTGEFQTITLADCSVFIVPDASGDASEPVWSETPAGLLQCTGKPRGYLYTNETFGDFVMEIEYRYILPADGSALEKPELANTGFLIYVPDEHKKWPRSPEVQGRWDEICHIKSNARDLTVEVIMDDQAARETARKPVGEWNAVRITSQGGALTSELNGVKICETSPCELTSGHIGLQAEDYAVEFRNFRVQRMGE